MPNNHHLSIINQSIKLAISQIMSAIYPVINLYEYIE